MVHYMIFGPGMENGKLFNKFFRMLQDGATQQKAFQDTFGDPHAFDSAFLGYVRSPYLSPRVYHAPRSQR